MSLASKLDECSFSVCNCCSLLLHRVARRSSLLEIFSVLKTRKTSKGLVSKVLERWIKVALLPEQNDGQKVLGKIQERKAGYSKTLQCLRAKKSEQWEKQNCKPRFVVAGSLCCEGKREHSCHIQNGNTKTNLEQEGILCIWQACYLQEAAKEKAPSHGTVGD